VLIDLHCHSTASDGTQDPADVMARAAAAGADVVALTDHDTTAGLAAAAGALPGGLTLVPGAELSCRLDEMSIHMLAYLFDPEEPDLAAERARVREARTGRARATVDRLVELGAPVTWAQVRDLAAGGTVGRPHIARAMVAAGVVPDVQAAFTTDWLAPGGRAYVTRYALDPVRAVRLIRAAGGVAVLAHPRASRRDYLVSDPTIEVLVEAGLAGLEVDHPDHDADDRAHLRGLAAARGLIATGASDDHGSMTGHRIGAEATADDQYERLLAAASGALPVSGGVT
jgi:hypothetical protein